MISASDLLALYPVPDPNASAEQYDRFYHFDLPGLTIEDLAREVSFLRFVDFLVDTAWHREREVKVAQELASRG